MEHLKQRYGVALDAALTPAERAVATAFQRLFEENLYWALVQTRWADDAGWAKTREAFFGMLPMPLRWFVPLRARRGLPAELRGQGMGRHSVAEIHAIGCKDVTAAADFLADKPFMLGVAPTSLDATAYAFLANPAVGAGRFADPPPRAGAADAGGVLPTDEGARRERGRARSPAPQRAPSCRALSVHPPWPAAISASQPAARRQAAEASRRRVDRCSARLR
jgi:hypothetical protein